MYFLLHFLESHTRLLVRLPSRVLARSPAVGGVVADQAALELSTLLSTVGVASLERPKSRSPAPMHRPSSFDRGKSSRFTKTLSDGQIDGHNVMTFRACRWALLEEWKPKRPKGAAQWIGRYHRGLVPISRVGGYLIRVE